MNDDECEHGEWEWNVVTYNNPYTGEDEDEYEKNWVSWENDMDLHRIKCDACGKISYYSGAAKDWYEKGISSGGIKGLG